MSDDLIDYLQKRQNFEKLWLCEHELRRRQYVCREKIANHKANIVLQSICTILLMTAGIHYAHKNSIVVPLLAAPSAAQSASKLCVSIIEKRRLTKKLNQLNQENSNG